jgi:hypothetical protein
LFANQEEIDNWAYQSASTRPGDIKYRDINGDGKIDNEDETIIGRTRVPERSVQNIKALTSACFYKEPDIPISISDKTQAVLLIVEYVSHSKMINPGKTIFIHGQQTIPIRMPNTRVYPLLKE